MTAPVRTDDVDQAARTRASRATAKREPAKSLGAPAADPATPTRHAALLVQRFGSSPTTTEADTTPTEARPTNDGTSQWHQGPEMSSPSGADAPPAPPAGSASPPSTPPGPPPPPAGTDAGSDSSGTPDGADHTPADGGTNHTPATPATSTTPSTTSTTPTSTTSPDGTPGTRPSSGGSQEAASTTRPPGGQRAAGEHAQPSGNGAPGGQPEGSRPAPDAMDLIEHELAEHQSWGEATAAVGGAQSAQRAEFIALNVSEGMGSGVATGAAAGLLVTLATSGAGRLLARRIPVPVIGSIIGGVIGAAGLVNTFANADSRAQLLQSVQRFGEGASGYERMANSIDAVISVLDVAANLIDTIGLVCGIIAAACWLAAVPTLGATSVPGGTATSIATYCGLASTVISLVKLGLQPLSLLFRSLHAFTTQADPREVQSQGSALSNAAKGLGGTLGGYAGSAAGRGISNAAGRRWPRQPAPRTTPTRTSQHPEGAQVHAERPADAAAPTSPARTDADGPGSAPTPARAEADAPAPTPARPEADAPTTTPHTDNDGTTVRPEVESPPMTPAQQRAADRAAREQQRQQHSENVESRRQEDITQRTADDVATVHQARRDTEGQIRNRLDATQQANQTRYEREMARIDASEATAVNRANSRADHDAADYARQSAGQAREQAMADLRARNQAAEARAERDFQRVERRAEAQARDIERAGEVRRGDAEYRPDLAFGENNWRTRRYRQGTEGMERRVLGVGPTRENMDAAMDGAQVGDITAGIFAADEGSPWRPGQVDRRYTRDNNPSAGVSGPEGGLGQSAADRADALVERVNPDYPRRPRVLPEDLAQQRDLIAQLRRSAELARLEANEEHLSEAETQTRAARIAEIRRINGEATAARAAHAERTRETSQAAEAQRERSQGTGQMLADASSRLAGVGTLITMLGAWRGTTAFVGGLLETVGASSAAASCHQSSRDAATFLGHLHMVRQTVSTAQAETPARTANIERDVATTRTVESEGREADTNIQSMQSGTEAMSTDNEQDAAAAATNARSAETDAERSERQANEQQEDHDRSQATLQDWAQRHRAARQAAVLATSTRLEALGYRVVSRSDW